MPTNYIGDKTATQAPSAPPTTDAAITAALPADGDPPNASTFAQAFKVCADFIAFLMKPQGRASQWIEAVRRWRAANGDTRFAIDHLGFPSGQIYARDYVWHDGTGSDPPAGAHTQVWAAHPQWSSKSVGTSGATAASSFVTGHNYPGLPVVTIIPPTALNDFRSLVTGPLGTMSAGRHVVLETYAGVDPAHAQRDLYIGFAWNPYHQPTGVMTDFVGFRRKSGVANWQCVTRAAGVETVTDSGVAVADINTTYNRLRIEWHGQSVSDDGNRRARFYVDGALVQTHSANLPADATKTYALISDQNITGVANTAPIAVGPVRVRGNVVTGDIYL